MVSAPFIVHEPDEGKKQKKRPSPRITQITGIREKKRQEEAKRKEAEKEKLSCEFSFISSVPSVSSAPSPSCF
jgi:hypothetical protein